MLQYTIKRKKRELRCVGLAVHIRNLCKEGAVGTGIKHEGGMILIGFKTKQKNWEFNFKHYREGCELLRSTPELWEASGRKRLHEKYNKAMLEWEKYEERLKDKVYNKRLGEE